MATVKVGTLLIRTLAKPISARIKLQAKEHERFRKVCISLAQTMYRYEVRLRTGLLGEPAKHIRPLTETRYGYRERANFLAEGFLFSVAVALIIGETWRSSRSQSKQRSDVNDSIDELQTRVHELSTRLERWEEASAEERERAQELARILDRVVEIGSRGGWAELQDTPLQFPRIHLNRQQHASRSVSRPNTDSKPSPTDTL
ncbi:optic atrophy 3 protein-domain-containing protein [Multifurca ochricompacta]|uniref:Optic atrophy 3 protein-domain-containing protein n=1 Tax=Multifurca ochricompacta TaxID=376703 RepID=A0AAD4LY31_9AGAM|nr:optic atrophy 3 protein-domain-containing protein [Multifurca ochricompacta]